MLPAQILDAAGASRTRIADVRLVVTPPEAAAKLRQATLPPALAASDHDPADASSVSALAVIWHHVVKEFGKGMPSHVVAAVPVVGLVWAFSVPAARAAFGLDPFGLTAVQKATMSCFIVSIFPAWQMLMFNGVAVLSYRRRASAIEALDRMCSGGSGGAGAEAFGVDLSVSGNVLAMAHVRRVVR